MRSLFLALLVSVLFFPATVVHASDSAVLDDAAISQDVGGAADDGGAQTADTAVEDPEEEQYEENAEVEGDTDEWGNPVGTLYNAAGDPIDPATLRAETTTTTDTAAPATAETKTPAVTTPPPAASGSIAGLSARVRNLYTDQEKAWAQEQLEQAGEVDPMRVPHVAAFIQTRNMDVAEQANIAFDDLSEREPDLFEGRKAAVRTHLKDTRMRYEPRAAVRAALVAAIADEIENSDGDVRGTIIKIADKWRGKPASSTASATSAKPATIPLRPAQRTPVSTGGSSGNRALSLAKPSGGGLAAYMRRVAPDDPETARAALREVARLGKGRN